MKKFVTLFTRAKNINIIKGVGQIPYHYHKAFGYSAELVTYKNDADYPFISETPGLELVFLENTGKISFLDKAVLKYLFNNSTKIDILNLYFYSVDIVCYGLLYKLLNPFGKLFIKLDIDYNSLKEKVFFTFNHRNLLKKIILNFMNFIFLKFAVDIMSIESSQAADLLKQKLTGKIDEKKILYLPIGIDDCAALNSVKSIKSYSEKENLIITVGRIGSYQKNSEFLLDVILNLNLKNWRAAFIGKIEGAFEHRINKIFAAYPELKEKIILTGELNDRRELYEWYNRAKIFCLTSRWESFGTALAEALFFGNYIITTDISSAADITDNSRIGAVISQNAVAEYTSCLQKIIDDENLINVEYQRIINHSKENFIWKNIIAKLKK